MNQERKIRKWTPRDNISSVTKDLFNVNTMKFATHSQTNTILNYKKTIPSLQIVKMRK